MKRLVRIYALRGADILVGYASFAMQAYLTEVWGLSFTHAAGILNIWGGIIRILQVPFSFLADQFLGNLKMLVLSSITSTMGLGLLTVSTFQIRDNPRFTCYQPQCIGYAQNVLFYTGMALIAVGKTGHLVSLDPFLEKHKGKRDGNARVRCLKILGFATVVISLVGAFALLSIRPWSLRFGIPTICTAVATFLFLSGWGKYCEDPPPGSPLTNICRVAVASWYKKSQQDVNELDRKDEQLESQSFSRTRFLGCLEKAAIRAPDMSPEDQGKNKWKVCSVKEVEEAKTVVRMVPMWMTFIVCGMVSSIGNTYFVEQAENMNRSIVNWKVPLPVLKLFYELAKHLLGLLADFLLEKAQKGAPPGGSAPQEGAPEAETKQRKYAPPAGIAVAMVFSVLCSVTAATTERERRHEKTEHNNVVSTFWLVLPFFLLAGLDSFFKKSIAAFYKVEYPKSMRNYLGHFSEGVSGLGFLCNVLLVYTVGRIATGSHKWFEDGLTGSSLDRYYWVLSVLSSVNLVAFIVVASCYTYKDPKEGGHEADGDTGTSNEASAEKYERCLGLFDWDCSSWFSP